MAGITSPQPAVTITLNILSKLGKVTVPQPKKDIPLRTLISIEKQSGLKLR
jgi:hypothetical protein